MVQFTAAFGAGYKSSEDNPPALSGSMVPIEINSKAMRLRFMIVSPVAKENGDPSGPWLEIKVVHFR